MFIAGKGDIGVYMMAKPNVYSSTLPSLWCWNMYMLGALLVEMCASRGLLIPLVLLSDARFSLTNPRF